MYIYYNTHKHLWERGPDFSVYASDLFCEGDILVVYVDVPRTCIAGFQYDTNYQGKILGDIDGKIMVEFKWTSVNEASLAISHVIEKLIHNTAESLVHKDGR